MTIQTKTPRLNWTPEQAQKLGSAPPLTEITIGEKTIRLGILTEAARDDLDAHATRIIEHILFAKPLNPKDKDMTRHLQWLIYAADNTFLFETVRADVKAEHIEAARFEALRQIYVAAISSYAGRA